MTSCRAAFAPLVRDGMDLVRKRSMQSIYWKILATMVVLAAVGYAQPAEPQDKSDGLQLQLKAKKDTYTWNGGGKTPQEYRKILDDLKDAKQPIAKKMPPVPEVDLVLQIVNTSKEEMTIYVNGTPNVYTFRAEGPCPSGGAVRQPHYRVCRHLQNAQSPDDQGGGEL